MLPWVEKYKPKTTKEVIGQELALTKIKTNIKKPILLYGPTGSGKTCLIHTFAKELNYEIVEINSSQTRNKDSINQILGNAINQRSLFYKGKIILIDDIDAISGTKDRGCLPTVISLMVKSSFPIIFTCTDPYIDKLKNLRKKAILIESEKIKTQRIIAKLNYICTQENIEFTGDDIQTIANKTQGDLRAAINDLQTHTFENKLIMEDESERDKTQDIIFCLKKIFQEKSLENNNIFYKTNLNTDEVLLWIDENLPKDYDSDELIKAYHYLSRADVFKGRIKRWQHWRFLVYINALITSGIAISKKQNKNTFTKYTRTTRILKLWQAKMRNAKKLTICEKIAENTHCSKKRAVQDSFPYLKRILNNPDISTELNLGEDEISWLNK